MLNHYKKKQMRLELSADPILTLNRVLGALEKKGNDLATLEAVRRIARGYQISRAALKQQGKTFYLGVYQ